MNWAGQYFKSSTLLANVSLVIKPKDVCNVAHKANVPDYNWRLGRGGRLVPMLVSHHLTLGTLMTDLTWCHGNHGKYLAPSNPTVSSPMSNTVYRSDAGFQFSHN